VRRMSRGTNWARYRVTNALSLVRSWQMSANLYIVRWNDFGGMMMATVLRIARKPVSPVAGYRTLSRQWVRSG
jgi:hypothetical protein